MSTFDSASLVMIPSGYKDQKVYSVKPIDGSGDLTFSRASNATRVNSSGLVEKVRTNLAFPSENFSAWTQKNGATTINTTANPIDGAITADTFVSVAQVGQRSGYELPFSTAVGELTASNYFKYVNNQWIFLAIYDTNNATYRTAAFDIQNGVAGVTSSGATSSIISVGGGWYRCSITYPITSSTTTYHSQGILNGNVLGVVCNTSGGESFISFGAQYENGVTTDYIATTSAAVSVGPVSGLPRLDYSGGASCPSLLLEPQRTNVVPYSEQFDNVAWAKVSATITANTTISPDGYQNADTFTTTGSGARISQSLSLGAGTYTVSLYVKKLSGSGNMRFFGVVDGSGVTQSFTPTDTWQRFTGNFTASTGITEMQLRENGFTGTLAIYGFQFELGSYPTSYIPTLSSAVTRVGDLALGGNVNIFNSSEGTLFLDFKAFKDDTSFRYIALSDGTVSNRVTITLDSQYRIQSAVSVGGVTQSNIIKQMSSVSLSEGFKIAMTYKNNEFKSFLNGVETTPRDTSGNTFAAGTLKYLRLNQGNLTSNPLYGNVNQILVFNTALSDAELATLTAL